MSHRVAVYCGSSPGLDARYMRLAESCGRSLAQAGFGLIYGGGQVGLMGALADGALNAGGEVIGVIPDFLQSKEIVSLDPRVDLRIVDSMHARKALATSLADGFIGLPGGYGTLEELFETVALAKLGRLHGPIILLNDGGFFDALLAFIDVAVGAGFVNERERALLIDEPTVSDTISRLDQAFRTSSSGPRDESEAE
jgi:uncharacterized protein (TIGR00730 family)